MYRTDHHQIRRPWFLLLRSSCLKQSVFYLTYMRLQAPVLPGNDSKVYCLIVRTTDYCIRRSWTFRIAATFYVELNAQYTTQLPRVELQERCLLRFHAGGRKRQSNLSSSLFLARTV